MITMRQDGIYSAMNKLNAVRQLGNHSAAKTDCQETGIPTPPRNCVKVQTDIHSAVKTDCIATRDKMACKQIAIRQTGIHSVLQI